MYAIRLKNISKTYRSATKSVNVLRNLNLDVLAGEFVAIIGESGQGKSTLLNILGCLDAPDRGEYWIGQEKVHWKSGRQLAKFRGAKVATIFQSFELVPHWTVMENVEMCMRYQKFPKSERSLRAIHALRQVQLLSHASRYPNELSGGEKQRCAIARAICAKPDILLADEPTGNLDPLTASKVLELLVSLKHQGMTILFVTHDHGMAQKADRIAILKEGNIEWWSQSNVHG